MTPYEIRQRLLVISRSAQKGDDEAAHIEEDRLMQQVLRAIADGDVSDPAECARLALTSLDIEFSRWYA